MADKKRSNADIGCFLLFLVPFICYAVFKILGLTK